jgi:hypothetical protein
MAKSHRLVPEVASAIKRLSDHILRLQEDAHNMRSAINWHEDNSGVSIHCARCGGRLKSPVEAFTLGVCEGCSLALTVMEARGE